jgi:hypothetical protein
MNNDAGEHTYDFHFDRDLSKRDPRDNNTSGPKGQQGKKPEKERKKEPGIESKRTKPS